MGSTSSEPKLGHRAATRAHVHEGTFAVAPERLFAALVEPSAIRRWWSAHRAIVLPGADGLWAAAWGEAEDDPEYLTVARIAEWDPPRKLVLADYRYRSRAGPLPFQAEFVTTFDVLADPSGSRLRVTQDGFPAGAEADAFYAACQQGWRATFAGLATFLEGRSAAAERVEPAEARPRFHCAFAVHDLAATRAFYGDVLGCEEGRSAERWVDFSLFGHQLSAHLVEGIRERNATNPVDGDAVPIPHFGLILDWKDWHVLAERLRARGTVFVIEPRVRFSGLAGEQATMFLHDPSGNALEFKAFQDPARIFAR